MPADVSPQTSSEIRATLVGGAALAALVCFGIGGWATMTELAGAVIAPGTLVVDSSVKKVQHPSGGVLSELSVREGALVRAGEVIARLDDTVSRTGAAVISRSMDELAAKQARLLAEQTGVDQIMFPVDLTFRRGDPQINQLMDDERRLFSLRKLAREGQKAQMRERLAQLGEQTSGMAEQVAAKRREIELLEDELKGVRELWKKNLIQVARVTALERDAARLQGERGALMSGIAQTRGKLTETELQLLQIDQDLRTEVGRDLAEIRAKLAELAERRVAADDQLRRTVIRAPLDGVVHQLAVHTVGGVVSAGETLMLIVPDSEALTVEAKIAPGEIDQVHVGQQATLRFSAFNQRTTPEVTGDVTLVSADAVTDPKSGAASYTIRISFSDAPALAGHKLVAGMPVESFVRTDTRSVLSYLTKPLTDQIARAWRER